jgi:hypothetical protein
MWSQLYREHFIMAFPSFDAATNTWVPQADITWCAGTLRDSEFVRFTARVATEDEAVSWAMQNGIEWIDGRLKLRSESLGFQKS